MEEKEVYFFTRKQLRYMGQQHLERMYTFQDVDVLSYAQKFQVQQWVSQASLTVIREYSSAS